MSSARLFGLAIVLLTALALRAAPVHVVEQPAVAIARVAGTDTVLVDFGRVAFGNVELIPAAGAAATVTIHFGEAMTDGRINRHPPGSVRYAKATTSLSAAPIVVAPPPDKRNTGKAAVPIPAEFGVVLPFRWVEIEGWPGELKPEQIRRRALFDATWRDDAASFRSSDEMLNQIWELCHYSIKATTFAGVFVDGDRERISYEADAYLNQLSYYDGDANPQMPRDTFDRLIERPTWPTEWAPHMVFMAYADWMQTGDRAWLAAHYDVLKPKLQLARAGTDGLLTTTPAQIKNGDIVDWPIAERDGYVFTSTNTVINAFHLRALALMSQLAHAIGREADAAEYATRERSVRAAFQAKLFDPTRGVYRDGVGTDHASLHANLFPLAFGLVPDRERPRVAHWLAGRGMACSVYAAQYFLEALFENGETNAALSLITAPGDRSWRHMIESGTTITWEAWDQKYKPNQDWNHAWGAAPANLLPRYVLGVQPAAPGWTRATIQPHPGTLSSCEGRIPTPKGPLSVRWSRGDTFKLALDLPAGISAQVILPSDKPSDVIALNGHTVATHREGKWLRLDADVTGSVVVERR